MAETALTSLPQFPPFDVHADGAGPRWKKYLAQFDNLLTGLLVKDAARKKALLLLYAGTDVYDIHDTLTIAAPDEANDVYKRSTDALTTHFEPKVSTSFAIFEFRDCKQQDSETVSEYVTRLRTKAKNCNFHDEDQEIKNQVIFSCTSQTLRRRALREDYKLDELLKVARGLELSEAQATRVEALDPSPGSVNKVYHKQQQQHKSRSQQQQSQHKPQQQHNTQQQQQHKFPRKFHNTQQQQQQRNSDCCGNCGHTLPHTHGTCPARGQECAKCHKIGHFARACRSRPQNQQQHRNRQRNNKDRANIVTSSHEDDDFVYEDDSDYAFSATPRTSKLPRRELLICGSPVTMTVDSGATVNILDSATYKGLRSPPALRKATTRVYPYGSNTPLDIPGCFSADFNFRGTVVHATVHVVRGTGGNLLSFTTAQELGVLSLAQNISHTGDVTTEFQDLFDGVGKINTKTISLHIDNSIQPKQQPLRRVPFHVRKDVDAELNRLLKLDIIEKAEGPTSWVSPVVVVPKKSSGVRLCVDMRQANKAVQRERHPMPTIDELITDLNGSTVFSTVDLTSGYHQFELDPASRHVTTFTTHQGLFRYKRLMFGINAASEIFQNAVEDMIRDLPGVKNISDDIIVHGRTQEEHDRRLRSLLLRLRQCNARLNKDKCSFSQKSISFYGHIFGGQGIRADPKKIEAIVKSAAPTNPSEVRSLLGMAQYMARFVPNFASLTGVLRQLTHQDQPWQWGTAEQQALDNLKQALTATSVMTYYDPNKPAELLVDGSPLGLGAILTQQGKVISYASRALTDVESRYSQTEREMLSVIWGMEHFHMYLFASSFSVVTDHKPLLGLVESARPASARLERWRLRLMPYDFKLKYRPGSSNPADYISRHPVRASEPHADTAEDYVHYITSNSVPKTLTMEQIQAETESDPLLQAVSRAIKTGKWTSDPVLAPLKHLQDEFSLCDAVVLRGTRIVIPAALQNQVVQLAHAGHQGIVKTKNLLREKVWFLGMDSMAESAVKSCIPCQAATTKSTPTPPLKPSKLPAGPWQEISMDFLGPLPSGEMLLVIVDDYSRYPEVEIVSSTSFKCVVPKLDAIFARHGIPTVIKSDNGPPFCSADFASMAEYFGCVHRRVTPLWPQANGEAEHFMSPLTKSIRTAHLQHKSWKQELYSFLRQYRATPHVSTKVPPAEALFGRKIRTRLPELVPTPQRDIDKTIRKNDADSKMKAKQYFDKRHSARESPLAPGDRVLVKQKKINKLTPPYDHRPLVIVKRKGSMITAKRGEYSVTRNISHFKRLVDVPDDYDIPSAPLPPAPVPPAPAVVPPGPPLAPPGPLRRSRRATSLPRRFRDFKM